jgi:dienelactone hydrolase
MQRMPLPNSELNKHGQWSVRYGIMLMLLLWVGHTHATEGIVGSTVEYTAGETALVGYLAYDSNLMGKLRPGILVVHEWWGHNEHAREVARRLAALGYTALALDMYGEGKQADHPEDAGRFSSQVAKDIPLARARFMAAKDTLQKHFTVKPGQIAAIGYCFGGGIVLQMAREGVDLDAVVSFHGSLATERPARPGQVKARVLVAHGADDPFVPAADIAGFKQEMDEAGVTYRFIAYPGAKHSFTNRNADVYGKKFNLPLAYNEQADQASWQDMRSLFNEVFGK